MEVGAAREQGATRVALAEPVRRSAPPAELRRYWMTYMTALVGVSALALAGLGLALRAGSWPLAIASAAVLAGLGVAVLVRLREFAAHRHLPGPRPSLLLGNLDALLMHGHGARDRALADLHARHGPLVRLHLAWGSAPFVSFAAVPDALHRKDLDSNRSADRRLLASSLMGMAMGERHSLHRQKLMPRFAGAAVAAALPRIREITAGYVATWRTGRTRHGDLQQDIHHWSVTCLGTYLCGEDWDGEGDMRRYSDALLAIEESISVMAFHPPFVRWPLAGGVRRARAAYRALFEFFADVMARRERRLAMRPRTGEPTDVLGVLVELKATAAAQWSQVACVEELISLVLGGTDAMSYTAAQALVLLSRDPAIQAEARREIEASPVPEDDPTFRSSLVMHVLRETLRLFPAVPFSSKVSTGFVDAMGAEIPAGTNMMWMKTVVGRNPDLFSDPGRFDPRRYLDGGQSIARAMPFGAGARHCIGKVLAEHQCAALLTAVLRELRVEPRDDVKVEYRATVSVVPTSVPVALVPVAAGPRRADEAAQRARPSPAAERVGVCPFARPAPT